MRIVSYILLLSVICFSCKSTKSFSDSGTDKLLPELNGVYQNVYSEKRDSSLQGSSLYVHRIENPSLGNEQWIYIEERNRSGIPIAYTNKFFKINKTDLGFSLSEFMPKSIITKPDILNPESFNEIKESQLMKKRGCTIFLHERSNGDWAGSTLGNTCKNRLKGSLYSRTELMISADTIRLVEQGFDEYDRHMWGPKKYAPTFIKLRH